MVLFQSIYPFSKDSSSKAIDEKCRVRKDSQSREETKSLIKEKNVAGSSKKLVVCTCALTMLALFLVAMIHFLYPSDSGNSVHPLFFASSEDVFISSWYPGDAQAKGYDAQKFIINPGDICSANDAPDDIKLLILVVSFIGNFDHRQAIRDTWGSLTTKSGPYRLGFIVGSTMNATASQLLQEESEEHQDIIQSNFQDTHQNLVLKSIATFKWVAKFCPHAKFFLKADDDIYINFAILSNILDNKAYLSNPNFITGFLKSGAYSKNETNAEKILSEDDYIDDLHNSYISGSAYLTTGSLSKDLYEISNEIKPSNFKEDAFITGICARKIGASLIHDDLFRSDKPHPTWVTYKGIATGNGLEPSGIYKIWKEMTDFFCNVQKN